MPVGAYNGTFTAGGGSPVGFDVQPGGYDKQVAANRTVRPVPWGNRIVVQGQGNMPGRLVLRVNFYTQPDCDTMYFKLGLIGTLIAPRYPDPGIDALLTEIHEHNHDRSSTNGPVQADLTFTVTVLDAVFTEGGDPVLTEAGEIVTAG